MVLFVLIVAVAIYVIGYVRGYGAGRSEADAENLWRHHIGH